MGETINNHQAWYSNEPGDNFPKLTQEEIEDIFTNAPLGNVLGPEIEALAIRFNPAIEESALTDEEYLLESRFQLSSQNIVDRLEQIKRDSEFEKAHGSWEHAKALGEHVLSSMGDIFVPYKYTLTKAKEKSGETEAATYGKGEFNGEECVIYAMNWSFRGGSVGVVAGEKLLAAARMAKKHNLPLVKIYSTGGMRQEENLFALAQMQRGVAAIDRYSQETDTAQIAVLLGQVWGGTSASTVPLADTIIGVEGSNFGFAGPNVIAAYEGQLPPRGSQSVESNYLRRYVDVIVAEDELTEYIGEYLRTAKPKINDKHVQPELTQIDRDSDRHATLHKQRTLVTEKNGFSPALYSNKYRKAIDATVTPFPAPQPFKRNSNLPEDLYDNYQKIIKDAGRPDGEFFIQNVFDEAIPLYNHFVRGNNVIYPPLIGAIARIGNQPFLVIANQCSYTVRSYKLPGTSDPVFDIRKQLATPGPQDYEWVERIMEMASRRNLPVVTFTDTLGALPTIEAERAGQSFKISRAIRSFIRHRKPVLSFIAGGLGSGGGIATTSFGPKLFMLDTAQGWVAEPQSAAAILRKTAQPSKEEVMEVLSGFFCTPGELKDIGFPIEIIQTSDDPFNTALNIRDALLKEFQYQIQLSERKLARLKQKSLYKLGQNAIKYSRIQSNRTMQRPS